MANLAQMKNLFLKRADQARVRRQQAFQEELDAKNFGQQLTDTAIGAGVGYVASGGNIMGAVKGGLENIGTKKKGLETIKDPAIRGLEVLQADQNRKSKAQAAEQQYKSKLEDREREFKYDVKLEGVKQKGREKLEAMRQAKKGTQDKTKGQKATFENQLIDYYQRALNMAKDPNVDIENRYRHNNEKLLPAFKKRMKQAENNLDIAVQEGRISQQEKVTLRKTISKMILDFEKDLSEAYVK